MTCGATRPAAPARWLRFIAAALVPAAVPLAASGPAAAQYDLAAVVCVGSELEVVTGPNRVPVTVRKDEEYGYVTDFDPVYAEEAEQAVREHLAGYTEIRCERSGPGDTHLVVVRFSAVFRGDERVDPGDPGFTNFAIGFGTSWDGAEANATDLDQHFAAYNDGSGYDAVLQLRWGEVEEDPDRPVVPRPEPEGLFRDCEACPGMVVVPAGTFMMGSPASEEGRDGNERPQRRVTIGAPFAVGVYEVTAGEWGACVLAGRCDAIDEEDGGPDRDRYPVSNVSWVAVQAYVRWLSAETGHAYRMLTEAEWEYVARAGTEGMRYWEGGASEQCEHANARDMAYLRERPDRNPAPCSDGYTEAAPVGMYAPNAFGLHDILGNVSEWTRDCWNPGYSGAPSDGSAWEEGNCTVRVRRGGSWATPSRALRVTARSAHPFDYAAGSPGFRVARDLN